MSYVEKFQYRIKQVTHRNGITVYDVERRTNPNDTSHSNHFNWVLVTSRDTEEEAHCLITYLKDNEILESKVIYVDNI